MLQLGFPFPPRQFAKATQGGNEVRGLRGDRLRGGLGQRDVRLERLLIPLHCPAGGAGVGRASTATGVSRETRERSPTLPASVVKTGLTSSSGKATPARSPSRGAGASPPSRATRVSRPWGLAATRKAPLRFVFRGQRKAGGGAGWRKTRVAAEATPTAKTTTRKGRRLAPACLLSSRSKAFVVTALCRCSCCGWAARYGSVVALKWTPTGNLTPGRLSRAVRKFRPVRRRAGEGALCHCCEHDGGV
jgi:hypothetical protein